MSLDQIKQSDIDLLVDGSLHGDQYRKMIQRLDATPGAWKQCALTFLEQQALAQELGAMLDPANEFVADAPAHLNPTAETAAHQSATKNSEQPTATRNIMTDGHQASLWKHLSIAVACSFLLAFGLGLAANHLWQSKQVITDNGNENTLVSNPTMPLVVESSGQKNTFEIPIVNAGVGSADLSQELPQTVDRLIQQAKTPYQVQRKMVPLTDKKGNVFYVPVDRVQFNRNSYRGYQ